MVVAADFAINQNRKRLHGANSEAESAFLQDIGLRERSVGGRRWRGQAERLLAVDHSDPAVTILIAAMYGEPFRVANFSIGGIRDGANSQKCVHQDRRD